MVKSMYVPSLKITYKIAEDIVYGNHIVVDGVRFELINKRPIGRRVLRSLVNESKGERIVIYS